MASGIISTRPQAENTPPQGQYEHFIQKRLEHTRRQVWLVDVISGLMLLAVASLLFFLAVAVLDHWVFNHGLGFLVRLGLFALWIGGAGAFVWRFLVPPLANRINPVFAAQTIEQIRPTLKNSLINFLLLRAHPQDVAPVVYLAMEHRAAADLLKVPVEHAVDRGRVVHLAYVLAAVVGVFALYLAFSPKNPLVSAGRVLWPWSNVPAPTRAHIEVSPGDAIVFTDDRQEISAQVTGLRDGEEVTLLVSTADRQVVDDRVAMTRVDDANHYRCELPPGSGGFQQDTFYCVTAGDATTQKYKLEVQIAPTIIVDRIDYHFPPYTGQADRTIKNQGDIKALEGTQVTIHATANLDIKEARIDLSCAGLQTLSMKTNGTKATGQFTLALDPDDARKAQYDCYQILFTDTNGHSIRRPVRYHIDVDRDLPPDIAIVEPHQEDVAVAEDGQLRIRVHAFDSDFALRHVTLQAEREADKLREAEKLGLPVLLDRTKPDKAWPKPFDGEYVFRPADLKLKAGDRVRYWATADDNKEPRPNHSDTSETSRRTIRIVGAGQSGQQDPQNPPQAADGQPQPNDQKPQPGDKGNKTEQGQNDPSNKNGSGSQPADPNSRQKTDPEGQETKSNDPQHGDKKDQGQPNNGGGPGKEQSSSDPANDQKSSEPNSGEANDPPNEKVNSETQQADAIKKIIEDQEKQKKDQQDKPEQSSGEQKPDQKQDPGQQGDNKQGSPQQDGQKQNGGKDGQKQKGDKGGQQPQGNSGEKKDQGGKGNPQPQGSKPDAGQNQSGQSKPDSKQGGGEQGKQDPSAGGGPKSEKPQPGGDQGKKESADGGNPPNSEKKQPGSQGGSDEKQPAQGGPKTDEKKPTGSGGSESQSPPGGEKPGKKPKDESSNSQGSGQSPQSKQEEKPGGGGQSEGSQKPKPGQGEQEGSSGGGKKPNGSKPGGNKGGTGKGEPGQKDPGKSGKPTSQDSSGAPDSQVDREKGDQKSGDAHEGMNQKSDQGQSPGNSPHESKSNSDSSGDRKGGGGAGGGQKSDKAGKGTAGTQKPADEGGSVSDEHGQGATGKKAGEEVRSTDSTGSSRKESGKGNGEKRQSADDQTAKDESQNPQGDSTRNSADSENKSNGGQSGTQSSKQAGNQGSGLPAGGSESGSLGDPAAASQQPQGGPDAASIEFSNKQVDLALEHLKDQMAKQKPELLDRLGWTKEEGQKFVENLKKLKDSAQRPGNEGEAAKKAYNEFLKNLDLHPHGTQIRGGRTKTDDMRNVRDSGQMEPPSDWADLYRAYSRSTAGQK